MNRFQHVDLRVRDEKAARAFYGILMPALGFTEFGGVKFRVFSRPGTGPEVPWFGFIEDPAHRPNANRIAFWAETPDEVDRLSEVVRVAIAAAGGRISSGPRACPEYGETYYAVFFEDPSGNCLEICFQND